MDDDFRGCLTVLGWVVSAALCAMAMGAGYAIFEDWEVWVGQPDGPVLTDGLVYVVSWVILLAISIMSTMAIREIQSENAERSGRRRANYIAIMIGLVATVFLFQQPYLEKIFGDHDAGYWLGSVLFAGGATSGWVVWYLRQVQKYGEFFNVCLLTSVTGLCWYARLTAPEEVQLTAVAFLLGSLFRVAKDLLDADSQP